MAASNTDVVVTATWVDLVATYPGLAAAQTFVQNKGATPLLVFFSASGTAPSDSSGVLVPTVGDYATGTADHIWVRALNGSTSVQASLTD